MMQSQARLCTGCVGAESAELQWVGSCAAVLDVTAVVRRLQLPARRNQLGGDGRRLRRVAKAGQARCAGLTCPQATAQPVQQRTLRYHHTDQRRTKVKVHVSCMCPAGNCVLFHPCMQASPWRRPAAAAAEHGGAAEGRLHLGACRHAGGRRAGAGEPLPLLTGLTVGQSRSSLTDKVLAKRPCAQPPVCAPALQHRSAWKSCQCQC